MSKLNLLTFKAIDKLVIKGIFIPRNKRMTELNKFAYCKRSVTAKINQAHIVKKVDEKN